MPVKIEKDNSITISGFEGIGQSPLSDFSDMMGVNTESPFVAGVNKKFNKVVESLPSDEFIRTGSTYQVVGVLSDMTYRGQLNGLAVTLTTTGTLPAGLSEDTIYYISRAGSSNFSFYLSTSIKNMTDGVYVSATNDGTGTHTITPITPKDIKHWTTNGQGKIFALDSEQRLWFGNSDGVGEPWLLVKGNTSFGFGSGLVYYKGYIIVFGNGKADALADIQFLTNTEPVWTNDFLPVTISNSGNANPYFSINDNAIYFYNGKEGNKYYKIAMLEENAGETFNPATEATFDLVPDVVTIPMESNGTPKSINELSENIVIGTESDKIYVWDKKSPSFTYFLRLQESNVNSIQVVDNIAYILMEDSASVYYSNLTSTSLLFKLPEQLTDLYYKYEQGHNVLKLTSSTVFNRELLFTVNMLTDDNTEIYNYLYSYHLDTQKIVKKNISSYGERGDRFGVEYNRIFSVFSFKDRNIFISSSNYTPQTETEDGYNDYAIESLLYQNEFYSGRVYYSVYNNYEPYIVTGLISYGDVYNKKTVRVFSLSLTKKLISGQGIKISYRRDVDDDWTEIKTIDYTTHGGIKDIKVESPVSDIIDIQLKIEFKGVDFKSPMLKSIRIIP